AACASGATASAAFGAVASGASDFGAVYPGASDFGAGGAGASAFGSDTVGSSTYVAYKNVASQDTVRKLGSTHIQAKKNLRAEGGGGE
ncbi:hypothetical protein IAI26_10865, partial [Streptococcus pseudopneumoniae]|uniref:hypothetical protein n=1 Tax=Streptococcus pseudopneumoniae TaxID=257758 RepID=UPI0019D68294